MRRLGARRALVAVALTAGVLTAACTSTVTGTAAPAGGGGSSPTVAPPAASEGDPVAWMDQVCGALAPLATTLGEPPAVSTSDLEALAGGLNQFFGDGVEALDTSLAGLSAAGSSPIDGGDELVSGLTDTLTTVRTSFADAKTQLDGIDSSDPSELVSVLPSVLGSLDALSTLPDPADSFRSNPELERAAEQAPNCQSLPR